MVFNSLAFFLFFPTVVILYFALPHKWRWLFLLLASCVFYMAFVPAYILILGATIIVDYIAGLVIERTESRKRRLTFLVASIVSNLGFLFFFKYYNFFAGNLLAAAKLLHWNYSLPLLSVVLPIGLSFHTFQALSYTIEVYRGNFKAEKHFGIYALYVMFFPQLVAGPIERPQNLLHQFYEHHQFEYRRVTDGLKLMAWGLFKKVVIADRLAILVNQVFDRPYGYSSVSLIFAVIFFAYQIYCDFSGYSDMAIGAAEVLGFRLMNNFNRPYFSKSVQEFWRRWHISLSSWFRDYVYFPLGGSRVPHWRWVLNILLVFLLSGLWHGANWTFVVWGLLLGAFMIVSVWTKTFRDNLWLRSGLGGFQKFRQVVQMLVTFASICFAWIFFRAANLKDAWYVVTHLFSGLASELNLAFMQKFFSGFEIGGRIFVLAVLLIVLLEAVELRQRQGDIRTQLSRQPVWLRWSVYYVIAVALLLLAVSGGQRFIYFQF